MRHLLSRLIKMRSSVVAWLILAQLSTVAGAFLINILSARALGPTSRGEIALILQLSYLAGALIPLGRDRAILQADLPQNDRAAVRSTLIKLAMGPLGVLGLCLALFSVWQFSLIASWIMILGFGLLLLGNLMSRFFRSEAIRNREVATFSTATVLGQVGLICSGGCLLYVGESRVRYWLLAYGASLAIPFAFNLLARRGVRGAGPPTIPTAGIRALGLRLMPPSVVEMAMTKSDRLLLPILGSYTALGYYVIAASLVDFSILPFRQYIDSKIPVWSAQYRERKLAVRTILFPITIAAMLLASLIAGFSYLAIPVLFGESYAPARTFLPWLGLASFFHIISISVSGLATALARTSILLRMQIVGILCAAPMHALLIPFFGGTGAAASQAGGFATSAIFGLLLLRKWRDPRRLEGTK